MTHRYWLGTEELKGPLLGDRMMVNLNGIVVTYNIASAIFVEKDHTTVHEIYMYIVEGVEEL